MTPAGKRSSLQQMFATVRAMGLKPFTVDGRSLEALADLTTDILADSDLKGGTFTLAIRDAEETDTHLVVHVELSL